MRITIDYVAQKLGASEGVLTIIDHEGVGDLIASLPRKLRAWRDQTAHFLIIRDNDRGACIQRKKQLQDIVDAAGKTERAKIRIVCQELESWFIGDTHALEALGVVRPGKRPRVLRGDPDMVPHPKRALRELMPTYQPISGSKAIAPHLDIVANRSASFRATVEVLREWLVAGDTTTLKPKHNS